MKWGLILSAGSAYGMANAGVLSVLERNKLRPDVVAGSSMGAIIGALYALGHLPSVFASVMRHVHLMNFAKLSEHPFRGGLEGGLLRQRLKELLSPLIGDARIADCRIPFVCVAGRVRAHIPWQKILTDPDFPERFRRAVEPVVLPPNTPLLEAILASSAIPVIFSPVQIGKTSFVDPFFFDAVPVQALRETYAPDMVIATDTLPRLTGIKRLSPPGLRALFREGMAAHKKNLAQCDLVITPKFRCSAWRFDKGEEFMEAGACAMEKALPKLRKVLGE